jgi:hypothetical protein
VAKMTHSQRIVFVFFAAFWSKNFGLLKYVGRYHSVATRAQKIVSVFEEIKNDQKKIRALISGSPFNDFGDTKNQGYFFTIPYFWERSSNEKIFFSSVFTKKICLTRCHLKELANFSFRFSQPRTSACNRWRTLQTASQMRFPFQ